ncbi:MAG: S-adenosyl-l-methionine hydroxide adenosyltransferase family protein, partial [Desulfovermiculus sp.]
MPSAFFLLTDFGLQDPYAGQMKAALWSRVPQAQVLDLSHGVRPHNVLQAAFFLASSWPYLPPESIGLAVVDPGVGTDRSILLGREGGKSVLAPDNGLLGLLLQSRPDSRLWRMQPPSPEREISSTFHGRDVFAPLACELADHTPPSQLGTEIALNECSQLPLIRPKREGNRIQTVVIHIDHFGNCVLNLPAAEWSPSIFAVSSLSVQYPRPGTVYPVSTYARLEENQLGILIGSQGYLELACNRDSCARKLGLDIGDEC